MNAIKKYKVPIIVVVALILAFIIYSYLKGDSSQDNAVLTSNAAPSADGSLNPESNAVGQAFLNQLLTLQNVKLDDSVFSDPRFRSLKDDNQPIPDEPQGRPNPFAPIGIDQSNGPTLGGSNGNFNFTFDSSTSSSSGGRGSATSSR